MAIETYQQRIGVTAGRQIIDPRFEKVSSVGGEAIGELGKALAKDQYEKEGLRIQKEAIKDAGVASIVKDEEGNYVRPPAAGGGRIYAETYDRITRERQATLINRDVQGSLDALLAEEKAKAVPNVENYRTLAMARIEGVLETVDPELRPDLESKLSTEFIERFRYLSGHAVDKSTRLTAEGLDAEKVALFKEFDNLLSADNFDDADRDAKIEAKRAEYVANVEARKALGIINEKSGNAELALLGLTKAEAAEAIAENDLYLGKAKGMGSFTIEQLQAITDETDGTDNPDAPPGYKYSDLKTLSQTTRNRLATQANSIASRKITARNKLEADAAERAREQREADRIREQTKELRGAIDGVRVGVGEMTRAQIGAINQDFQKKWPDATAMRNAFTTPQGQKEILNFVAQYGQLPTAGAQFLNNYVLTEGGPAVLNLLEGVQNAYTNYGNPVGDNLIKALEPRTRVAYSTMLSLRRGGANDRELVQAAQNILSAKIDSLPNVKTAFVDMRGRGVYETTRKEQIALALGGKAGDYIPDALLDDFDNLITYQMGANGNVPLKAAQATAKMVAQGWDRSPLFHGGFGPKHYSDRRITAGDLDKALFNNKGPISFGNLKGGFRATIQPVSYAPEKRFGYVRINVTGPNGFNRTGQVIDLDKVLAPYLKQRAAASKPVKRVAIPSRPKESFTPLSSSSMRPGY